MFPWGKNYKQVLLYNALPCRQQQQHDALNEKYSIVQYICFLGVGKITIVGQNKRQQLDFSELPCLCRTLVPTNC